MKPKQSPLQLTLVRPLQGGLFFIWIHITQPQDTLLSAKQFPESVEQPQQLIEWLPISIEIAKLLSQAAQILIESPHLAFQPLKRFVEPLRQRYRFFPLFDQVQKVLVFNVASGIVENKDIRDAVLLDELRHRHIQIS